VELEVHYGVGKNASKLYEDVQDRYDYTKDRYSYRTFKMLGKSQDLIIQQHKRGDYITTYDSFRVQLIGLPFNPNYALENLLQLENAAKYTVALHF